MSSTVDSVLERNRDYAEQFTEAGLPGRPPRLKLAVLTCLDCRLHVPEFLGLELGDAQCGMLTFKDEELASRLESETGKVPVVPARFLAFTDLEENVREQIRKVRSHPWIPESLGVRGFIYDVDTGGLAEVSP